MRRRLSRLAPALALGLVFLTGVAVAQVGSTPTERPVNCTVDTFADEGTHRIPVPGFCRTGMCDVFVSWEETFFGAFGPGLLWPTTVFQQSDGRWVAGPAVNIAGLAGSDGFGINGNGISEAIIGGSQTVNGSFWSLLDDSSAENAPNLWSLELGEADPTAPELINFSIYACTSGYRYTPTGILTG
jgi:hypothetical protein